MEAPKIVFNLVNELLVHCPREVNGCSKVVQRYLLPYHLKDECEYDTVECGYQGCLIPVNRREWYDFDCSEPQQEEEEGMDVNHEENTIPKYHLSHDPDQSKNRENEDDMERHGNEFIGEDGDEMVVCEFSKYGCRYTCAQSQMESHKEECVFAKLEPTIATFTRRLDTLTLETHHLRTVVGSKDQQNDTSQPSSSFSSSSSSSSAAAAASASAASAASASAAAAAASNPLANPVLCAELDNLNSRIEQIEINNSMLYLNEMLRMKEEMHGLRGAVATLRYQVGWLMGERRSFAQRQQTIRPGNKNGSGNDINNNNKSANSISGMEGAVKNNEFMGSRMPPRRLSDPARQDVKL